MLVHNCLIINQGNGEGYFRSSYRAWCSMRQRKRPSPGQQTLSTQCCGLPWKLSILRDQTRHDENLQNDSHWGAVGGRFLKKDPIYCKMVRYRWYGRKKKISHCIREIKRGRRADRQQHPVTRAQEQEEPTLGGQPHQVTAIWEVLFQKCL